MSRLAATVNANFDLKASPFLSSIASLFIAGRALPDSSREAAKRPNHSFIYCLLLMTLISSVCLSCVILVKRLTLFCLCLLFGNTCWGQMRGDGADRTILGFQSPRGLGLDCVSEPGQRPSISSAELEKQNQTTTITTKTVSSLPSEA